MILVNNCVKEVQVLDIQKILEESRRQEPCGLEHARAEDLASVSRLVLLHPVSDIVIAERAKAGEFYDTGAEEPLGKELFVTPVFHWPSRRRREVSMTSNSGPTLCFAPYDTHGHGEPGGECCECPDRQSWDPENKRFTGTCVNEFNFCIYLHTLDRHLLLTLSRTTAKVGRQWLKLIRRTVLYHNMYKLSATTAHSQISGKTYNTLALGTFEDGSKKMSLISEEYGSLLPVLEQSHRQYEELYAKRRENPEAAQESGLPF